MTSKWHLQQLVAILSIFQLKIQMFCEVSLTLFFGGWATAAAWVGFFCCPSFNFLAIANTFFLCPERKSTSFLWCNEKCFECSDILVTHLGSTLATTVNRFTHLLFAFQFLSSPQAPKTWLSRYRHNLPSQRLEHTPAALFAWARPVPPPSSLLLCLSHTWWEIPQNSLVN